MKKNNEKIGLHPVMVFIILILGTIVLSGFLRLLNIQSTYNSYSLETNSYVPVTESITSLFNLRGVKYIFTNTVSNFANFTALSHLIIILIGIGIMEKSGFLKTFVTITTKRLKKQTVTFGIVLFCLLASIAGDLPYVVMIPLSALIFYHGKRNPNIGIIASFASLCCGSGLSLLFTSLDVSLMDYTILNTSVLDGNYVIKTTSLIFINLIVIILAAIFITKIVENYVSKKLPKYEFEESTIEEEIITKKQLKGLIYAGTISLIYLLIFVYNIIPGLPFSGNLLDYSQTLYIDKLFSFDSFFTNGFVFIVTMLFLLVGLFYGIGAKTIKNNKDFVDSLGYSLNGIGKTVVLIFMASAFISIFKHSGIGTTLIAILTNFIISSNFTGLPLVIMIFIFSVIGTILVPSSLTKWSIMSASIPTVMNAGISPEFAQVIFRFGECVSMCLTPLFAYFIIYLAYLEKYNQNNKNVKLFTSIKYLLPFAALMFVICLTVIIIFYVTNLPLGFGGSVAL